jgi:phage tail sheath gpL-like
MSELSRLAYTAAAASLTGFASNVTGAVWAIAVAGPADGLAHHVTIHNDSTTNHSAKTIVLTGTGANGEALTETLAAPNTSATVTSTKAFKTLTSAVPSATIGADTFDIGWAATGHTPWVKLRDQHSPFSASMAVYLTSGSLNFDGQITMEATPGEDSTAFNHADLTAKTASAYGAQTAPVTGFRVDVNSHTNAVFTVVVNQAGYP